MSVPGLAHQERIALCDLFTDLGPDAPTLCEGWVTRDLAAHLVARETRPDAVPGLLIPGVLAGWTARLERAVRDGSAYPALVERIRTGPPLLGPMGLPLLRETANIHEFYVHHEDVRRPNGLGVRRLSRELEDALWRRLRLIAPFLLRRVSGAGVVLARRGHGEPVITGKGGEPVVRLEGRAGELFMYLFNRRDSAEVTVTGPREAVAALADARLGL